MDGPVPLVRRFCPIAASDSDSDEQDVRAFLGSAGHKTWPELDKGYRTVILAEAGAGKTFEMQTHAKYLAQQGLPAFFIRIEDIDVAFEEAFEVGTAESLAQWLDSQAEAWFFLDSIDEARLDNPTTFAKAIRRFATRIKGAQQRAHVCISSRPHAWRAKSDRELVQQYLPFKQLQSEPSGWDPEPIARTEHSEDALEVLVLQPLEEADIRLFATERSAPDVDGLIRELERTDLMALAGRPFDLAEVIDKWKASLALGSRKELLLHSIARRLGEPDADRAARQVLNADRARYGARVLAAAVVLTGQASIRVPDGGRARSGIVPEAILADWQPSEVQDLVAKPIFDDVTYGAVRFRHRDVRELLAAEWFGELLRKGHSRNAVERLFFREQYGVEFVSPRLSVVLPWLILDDQEIRERVLGTHPEIAVQGGDLAQLPLLERKKILTDILDRISRGKDDRSARDNYAIARIAQRDLAAEASALIYEYGDNDDAIFFLGRLIWQGEMSECVGPLLDAAVDPARRVPARIAATRAVMTCGTDGQKSTLWDYVGATQELPRRLLAEVVRNAEDDASTVPLLLNALEGLAPYQRFEATGLTEALHGFIERLQPSPTESAERSLHMLVAGLNALLSRQPFIDQSECQVSERFSWLLGPAIHAVETLVSARADAAMDPPALAIMLNAPATRHWHDRAIDDYEEGLADLVPAWPELNDCLFWENVKVARIKLEADGNRLADDWPVQWPEHYWSFGPDSLSRLLEWVTDRQSEDDRLVALSLATRVYGQAEQPAGWVDRLRASVAGDGKLTTRLNELLNPTISEETPKWQRREAERQRRLERQSHEEAQRKLDWTARLKGDPSLVRIPPGLAPGDMTWDQWWLLREIAGDGPQTSRAQGADWRSLIDKFGEDVAVAYRDAAVAHWRHYTPGLRSEGANTSSVPGAVIFGLAGLAIEAAEVDGFPAQLPPSEVRLALRYFVWELNGFPAWLEAMHRAYPRAVMDAVGVELFWELAHTDPGQPMHYVLHDLAIYAPWLHESLFGPLLTWLQENDPPSDDALRHILSILKGGSRSATQLAAVAKAKATQAGISEHRPYWYAVWVDAAPDSGIVAVENWLSSLDRDEGSSAAQHFIAALMGNSRDAYGGPKFRDFLTPAHLKRLYLLAHEYIRISEDIDRIGGGAYSPELRDHAQDARDSLFRLLADIPGKETYVALTQLIEDHPVPDQRAWMAKRAFDRARTDGDLELWTADQIREFGRDLTTTPTTQRQLFDLAVARVTDLKNWLERGNDSPYRTWQRAEDESEVRNLVAGWLNQGWGNSFTSAQEPELANRQRMDIWLQNPDVPSPVPIEIKLLDKGWSGPKLCERLGNQLAGDYLREASHGYGLMLLVWKGDSPGRRWRIGEGLVGVPDLRDALKHHWDAISHRFPNVVAVEVVLIDLMTREKASDLEL